MAKTFSAPLFHRGKTSHASPIPELLTSLISGQFPELVVSYFHLSLNEKKNRGKKEGGGVLDSWLDVRKRGGGHSNAYSVQQGGRGGPKIGNKCVCN